MSVPANGTPLTSKGSMYTRGFRLWARASAIAAARESAERARDLLRDKQPSTRDEQKPTWPVTGKCGRITSTWRLWYEHSRQANSGWPFGEHYKG
jgi:hypothetical protein